MASTIGSGVVNFIRNIFSKIAGFLLTRVGVAILVVAVIILSVTTVLAYTEYNPASNELCTVCHSMQPFKDAIDETPHGALNCHTCHELTPAVVNELIVFLTENPSPEEIKERGSVNVRLLDECLECHKLQDLSEMPIHDAHIKISLSTGSCNLCHNPHSQEELDVACSTCHNTQRIIEDHSEFHTLALAELDKGNDEVCLKCHSSDAKWQIEICPESVLGLLRGNSCFDCHQAPLNPPNVAGKSCTDCHGH